MKHISVITPCYNEEGNVEELYKQVKAVRISKGCYRDYTMRLFEINVL